MGKRPELTWRDVWIICTAAPAGSPLAKALTPSAAWTVAEHLAAAQVDALRWMVWAKTKNGSKNRNRPTPIPRPGERKTGVSADVRAMSIDEMKAYLARPRVALS